jgi:hypothetical protein
MTGKISKKFDELKVVTGKGLQGMLNGDVKVFNKGKSRNTLTV